MNFENIHNWINVLIFKYLFTNHLFLLIYTSILLLVSFNPPIVFNQLFISIPKYIYCFTKGRNLGISSIYFWVKKILIADLLIFKINLFSSVHLSTTSITRFFSQLHRIAYYHARQVPQKQLFYFFYKIIYIKLKRQAFIIIINLRKGFN